MTVQQILLGTALLGFIAPTLAHMEMSWPYPYRSKYDPKSNFATIDYSMTSPLAASGSNFPCKGYQDDTPQGTVYTFNTGQTYNITLAGSATHGGGSCQISLSYDNGTSFRVIKSMIGGCPLKTNWDFSIPTYVPSGSAMLAWSWQNLIGNREFYMNCAPIVVAGGSLNQRRGAPTSLNQLPSIWVANLQSINKCVTVENDAPVYPDPGPEVEYNGGYSSSSPVTPGNCELAISGNDPSPNSISSAGNAATVGSASPSTSSTQSSNPASSSQVASTTVSTISTTLETESEHSTTAPMTTDAPTTSIFDGVTSTFSAASSTTSGSNDGESDGGDDDNGDDGEDEDGGDESGDEFVTMTGSGTLTSLVTIYTSSVEDQSTVVATDSVPVTTTDAASSPTATTSSSPTSPPPTSGNLDFVPTAEEANEYHLPCIPNSLLCMSDSKMLFCAPTNPADPLSHQYTYSYGYAQSVAAGMACQPYIAPGSTQRDDLYVRAQAGGGCTASQEGLLKCSSNGSGFYICDQGSWTDMGGVAPGTTCQNGAIVSLRKRSYWRNRFMI